VTSLDPKLQRCSSHARPRLRHASTQSANFAEEFQLSDGCAGHSGLTDHEVPNILEACANAGAQFAGYTIVRLPWAVAPLFEHWLEEHFPDRKEKVLGHPHLRRSAE
jgi:hypothetical protein